MIITRTPFRISFFGGGTDIPGYFREAGGQVLSTTIDKYCYVTARVLPPFFDHSIRLAYSRMETCRDLADIQHPLVRSILEDFNRNNIEIHYDADLPGNSGLGSSSSFGVGLTTCLLAMEGKIASKYDLARRVIHYEREKLREHGGYQDQVAAAYGGFNHIRFFDENQFSVQPLPLTRAKKEEMLRRLILCYIPKKRYSSDVSVAQKIENPSYRKNLRYIYDTVDKAIAILQSGNIDDLGELLHETWVRKREFAGVSDKEIDSIYERARAAGALGGKLLGAGGGGFMLVWAKPDDRDRVIKALDPLLIVPFDFDTEGAQIIYYSNRS